MNKLQMAHEYAIALISNTACGEMTMDDFIALCHNYADGMVKEYEERQDKSRPDAIEKKQIIPVNGGYYQDYVNFDYYKLDGYEWYKLESVLSDKWIKCAQPNIKWLVEDRQFKK